jgi:hypothetical protein
MTLLSHGHDVPVVLVEGDAPLEVTVCVVRWSATSPRLARLTCSAERSMATQSKSLASR